MGIAFAHFGLESGMVNSRKLQECMNAIMEWIRKKEKSMRIQSVFLVICFVGFLI